MPNFLWVILGLSALLVVLLLQFRWHWYILQYLFFLRFPLLLGSLLVFSFLAGYGFEPAPSPHVQTRAFHNLFVLEPFGLFLVPVLAVFTAWTIVNAGRWIYAEMPKRVGLSLRGYKRGATLYRSTETGFEKAGRQWVPMRTHTIEPAGGLQYLAYAILAAPLIICVGVASPGRAFVKTFLVCAGIGVAFGLRAAMLACSDPAVREQSNSDSPTACTPEPGRARQLLRSAARRLQMNDFEKWLAQRVERSDRRRRAGEADRHAPGLMRRNAGLFFATTLLFYLILGVLLWPGRDYSVAVKLQGHVPALAYILLLTMFLAWGLSWFSLRLDGFRVPAEAAIVLIVALVYKLPFADTDHYYQVGRVSDSPVVEPRTYLEGWLSRREKLQPIAVAGSGGGIAASAWVATVLTGLQSPEVFGNTFAQSIAFVSTTSGGGVGAMYYLDGFRDAGAGAPPEPPQDSAWILRMASRSSLGAMAWGLVYPDFARLLFPPLAAGSDRGWALERRWKQPMGDDDGQRRVEGSLRSWGADVAAGWRPVQVFNATLLETGGRLLIAPIAIRRSDQSNAVEWQAQDFVNLYPNVDIAVVTAARLSAAFPFVTPGARPAPHPDVKENLAYHVVDGGYFDNFGMMSTIEVVRETLPTLRGANRKILILEIRTGGAEQENGPLTGEGFRIETIGPAETLMAVRNTSQLERNDLELKLLRSSAVDAVIQESVVFELRTKAPLSWHLSDDESRRICAYWVARCGHNEEALQRVADFLGLRMPPRSESSLSLQSLCDDPDREVPESFHCPMLEQSSALAP